MPAIIIGLVAGIVCDLAARLLVRLNLDDALSVWGVHGIGGTWGSLATGLFVGIGFGSLAAFTDLSRAEQTLNQIIAIVATWGWAFVLTGVILWLIKITIGLRVSDNSEAIGLDIAEHGEASYRW